MKVMKTSQCLNKASRTKLGVLFPLLVSTYFSSYRERAISCDKSLARLFEAHNVSRGVVYGKGKLEHTLMRIEIRVLTKNASASASSIIRNHEDKRKGRHKTSE